MEVCADARVVTAKIISLGCIRRGDLDKDGLWYFSYQGYAFPIPQPLVDGGYTEEHLTAIEFALAFIGLELLPLDPNLVH